MCLKAKGNCPEDSLERIDKMNKTLIPALHMVSTAAIFGLNVAWFFNPELNIVLYTSYQWLNFCAVVCVLMIETYVKNDDANRVMLTVLGTVKRSYLRYISHELRTPGLEAYITFNSTIITLTENCKILNS